jgi:hypothetical protein
VSRAKPAATVTPTGEGGNTFDTVVEVCCHRVAVRYWDFTAELTDELRAELTEEGERRAQECIIDGCRSGQLVHYWHNEATGEEEEIFGWWEIEKA